MPPSPIGHTMTWTPEQLAKIKRLQAKLMQGTPASASPDAWTP